MAQKTVYKDINATLVAKYFNQKDDPINLQK